MRTYSTKFYNHAKKAMTELYDFSNFKSSKMLSFDSVAEAYGLICPRPLGEIPETFCLMTGEVSRETSPKNIMIQDMINSENSKSSIV